MPKSKCRRASKIIHKEDLYQCVWTFLVNCVDYASHKYKSKPKSIKVYMTKII